MRGLTMARLLALLLALGLSAPSESQVPELPVINMGTPPVPAGVRHCCGGGGRAVNASCCDPLEKDAVLTWLGAGGVGMESSLAYGTSPGLGQGLRESGRARTSVWITTKVQCGTTRAAVAAEIEKGLTQLGVPSVDLLTIHCTYKPRPPACASSLAMILWLGPTMQA